MDSSTPRWVPSHQVTWNLTGESWKTIVLLKGPGPERPVPCELAEGYRQKDAPTDQRGQGAGPEQLGRCLDGALSDAIGRAGSGLGGQRGLAARVCCWVFVMVPFGCASTGSHKRQRIIFLDSSNKTVRGLPGPPQRTVGEELAGSHCTGGARWKLLSNS